MSTIESVHAREILDSRGNPTVEVEVILADGAVGRAAVPSGASTGAHEALELRDQDTGRYLGRGVLKAVANVNDEIAPRLHGQDATEADRPRRAAASSSTAPRTRPSSAPTPCWASRWRSAHAAAASVGLPLYRYLGGVSARYLPVPMMNFLNGGKHADNNVDFQEFMIMPLGAGSSARRCAWGRRSFTISKRCCTTAV